MSFYKITDPKERRRMIEKLAQTRKNVQEQFLDEKLGKIESSESLKTFFKPVTESQRELTKEIKEQLTPIRDKVLRLPSQTLAITPPTLTEEELMMVGPIAKNYLNKYIDLEEDVDMVFGIYGEGGREKIGSKEVTFNGNDLIIEGKTYQGTRGLWELIVSNEPDDRIYDDDDLDNYTEIMIKTNAMRREYDPANPRPRSSTSWKWKKVVKGIWDEYKASFGGTGTKTIVIPSDPNALLERLDLLMASREAGNTGTRNELVSICDELLRQKIINKNEYKNIMLRL